MKFYFLSAIMWLASAQASSPSSLSLSSSPQSSSSRKLFFAEMAGYQPESLVVSEYVIDLDVKMIIDELYKDDGTVAGFGTAVSIYEYGANSEPIAKLKLKSALTSQFAKGTVVRGFSENLEEVVGTLVDDYISGTAVIEVAYEVGEALADYPKCLVGGSPDPVTEGCFVNSEIPDKNKIIVSGTTLYYEYDPLTDNSNGISIKLFSSLARKHFYECQDPGDRCPYPDYETFYLYYGQYDYVDEILIAVSEGGQTQFDNGNFDFRDVELAGRFEAFKDGIVYLAFFMQVIGTMEQAIGQCGVRNVPESINLWDKAVAYYAGSLQGSNRLGEGVLLYNLAKEMCHKFRTCGMNSDFAIGDAYVNQNAIQYFIDGQHALSLEECEQARLMKSRIAELMKVPLVQTILYEAYRMSDGSDDGAISVAVGAMAAGAILPYIHQCDEADAILLYDQMKVDSSERVDFDLVKKTLEKHYQCLGITCEEVGGIFIRDTRTFATNAGPCGVDDGGKKKKNVKGDGKVNVPGLAVGLAVGGAVLIFFVVWISSCCGVQAAPPPSGLEPVEGAQVT